MERHGSDLRSDLAVANEKQRQLIEEVTVREQQCVVNKVEITSLQDRLNVQHQTVSRKRLTFLELKTTIIIIGL